jgi:hypothetical protein
MGKIAIGLPRLNFRDEMTKMMPAIDLALAYRPVCSVMELLNFQRS